MLGYNDLRDPSVSGFFRFLARVGDGMMKMQIVKIKFGNRKSGFAQFLNSTQTAISVVLLPVLCW